MGPLALDVTASIGNNQNIVNYIAGLGGRDISEETISQNLYTKNVEEPDLLIRTGGEMRVSNYLLWQIAYSEFYVTSTFWPDFGERDLLLAVRCFSQRDRRFGKK